MGFRFLFAFAAVCMVALVWWSASMPTSVAVDALTKQGFTDVQVTARYPLIIANLMGCGKGDLTAFKVEAVNVKGEKVSGITVCAGLLKGVTTRF